MKMSLKNEGINQPPKKKSTVKVDINNIFEYSPKKKYAKGIALCSVKYPATNSDSASGKSNGAQLVSANADIINNKPIGIKGIINHCVCCDNAIIHILGSPIHIIIIIVINPNTTSYDII
jgi:hypothetical protein